MNDDYQRGYTDGLRKSAEIFCFQCRDGVPLFFRPHMTQFSHKMTGQSDPKFVHWEPCKAGALWALMADDVAVERAPAQAVLA